MSLGIAKIIDSRIYIHADSLMTGNDVVSHDLQKHSVLKAILINPQLCVVFAGNIDVANNLLQKIYTTQLNSLNQFISFMLSHHKENDLVTDYIIASTFNNRPLLFEIKNGSVNSYLESSWVGSKVAFACFQEYFEESKNRGVNVPVALSDAFGKVLEDERAPDVGGFHFTINQHCVDTIQGKPFILNYDNHIFLSTSVDQEIMKKYGGWDTTQGSVADGTFAYTSLPSMTVKYPGVGLYFGHVKLGLMFSFQNFGLFPKEYRDCSSLEFAEEMKKIGIKLKGNVYEKNGRVQVIL